MKAATKETPEITPAYKTTSRLLQIRQYCADKTGSSEKRVQVVPLFQVGYKSKYRIHVRDSDRRLLSSHFISVEDPKLTDSPTEEVLAFMLDSDIVLDLVNPPFRKI